MKKRMILGILLGLFLTTAIVSCKDDNNEPTYKKETIGDATLLKVLKTKGFNFEGDLLIIDDKINDAKTLDLSGSGLSKLTGLKLFPNLETVNLSNNNIESSDALADLPAKVTSVNLAKNKFVTVFDFAKLPESVKSVDLSDNEIYEYKNLKTTRKFTKLFLPEGVLYDLNEVVNYYKANKDVDIQVETGGKLGKYSLLRNIADENMRTKLKELFPSIFTGEQIDLEKSLSDKEISTDLTLGSMWVPYDKEVASLDGLQFIVCRDKYKGKIDLHFSNPPTISYFKAPKNAIYISLKKVKATGVFDFSTSVNAGTVKLSQVSGVKKLDVHNNTALGNASLKGNENSYMGIILCPDLETLVTPDNWEKLDEVAVSIGAAGLPKLKSLDISKVNKSCININNTIGQLSDNIQITYPIDYRKKPDVGGKESPSRFQVDAKVKESNSFKSFFEKNKSFLTVEDLNPAFLPFY